MSANRKFAFMFEDGNQFHAAKAFIAENCLLDHFSAGLNGINGQAIALLLDALIKGELEPLVHDETMKGLWLSAGWKPEHLIPGAVAIVATGRGFGFAKQSKLPISQGKVFGENAMKIKGLVWDTIGNGQRHFNEVEIMAVKNAPKPEIVNQPVADNQPEKVKKPRSRKAKKQAETVELQQAA